MLAPSPSSGPLSKFAFCDLVLASALELEKARGGKLAESEPIRRLADALTKAARPVSSGDGANSFVDAGYFLPLERLYTRMQQTPPTSISQIQDFVNSATDSMRADDVVNGSNESVPDLISFCVALHKELVRGLEAENSVVVHESRRPNNAAEALVS